MSLKPFQPEMAEVESGTISTARGLGIALFSYVAISIFLQPDTFNSDFSPFLLLALALLIDSFRKTAISQIAIRAALSVLLVVCVMAFGTDNLSLSRGASTALFVAMQIGTVSLGRRNGGLFILATLPLAPLVILQAEFLVSPSSSINARWGTVLQYCFVGFWVWKIWYRTLTSVQKRDAQTALNDAQRRTAIAELERTRIWRESLVRTHETVLNDIRSVLDAKKLDYKALRVRLESQSPPAVYKTTTSLHEVLQSSLQEESAFREIEISGENFEVQSDTANVLRAVMLEITRNIQRHSAATSISFASSSTQDSILIVTSHNGTPLSDSHSTGIGRGVVIRELLKEIGAEISERPLGSTIVIPRRVQASDPLEIPSSEIGRDIISAVSAGNMFGGALFFFWLIAAEPPLRGIGITALTIAVIALVTSYQAKIHVEMLGITANILALVNSYLLFQSIKECQSIEVLATVAVLVGFGLTAIISWVNTPLMWISSGWWLPAVFIWSQQASSTCSIDTSSIVSTAFVIPLFIALILYGSFSERKRVKTSLEIASAELAENVALEASRDIASSLESAVNRAQVLLHDISTKRRASQDQKRELAQIDSLIRASLQVDPKRSGELAAVAHALVSHYVEHDCQVKVLSINDDHSQRALNKEVLDWLRDLPNVRTAVDVSVQVLSNRLSSTLILTFSGLSKQQMKQRISRAPEQSGIIIRTDPSEIELRVFVEQVHSLVETDR